MKMKQSGYDFRAEVSFRPLIRGFFFYKVPYQGGMKALNIVSVPLFGDSFFIIDVRGKPLWV